MWRKRILSIAVALCALIFTSSARAKTIYVDDDAPGDGDGTSWATAYRFLQDGLAQAVDGDEVRVGQGEYEPDRSASNPEGTRDRSESFQVVSGVHLRGGFAGVGTGDPDAWDANVYRCILSGDLNGDDEPVADPCDLLDAPSRLDNAYHVAHLMGGMLEGMEITGGYAHRYRASAPFTMSFTTDHAGGGVWGDGTMQDCLVLGNYGEEAGGGLWCAGDHRHPEDLPSVVMRECRFIGNATRFWGGGICLIYAETHMTDCQFRDNRARNGGGGVFCGDARLEALGTEFSRNQCVTGGGGGVTLDDSVADFEQCTFTQNVSSEASSGGLGLGSSEARLLKCTMSYNTAHSAGGAIACNSADIEMNQCLIVGNRSEEHGGAVSIRRYSSASFCNCTVVSNRGLFGNFLSVGRRSASPAPSSVSIKNCVVSEKGQVMWNYDTVIDITHTCMPQAEVSWHDPGEGIEIGPGSIEADPCFADLGYWDDNDTPDDPNDDVYVVGDYHLKSQASRWDPASGSWVQDDVTSPCIDAGDPNSPIMHEPFPNGGIVNMGAYGGTAEASKSYFGGPVCETIIAGDINGDCKVDINDLILLMSHWLQTGTETP